MRAGECLLAVWTMKYPDKQLHRKDAVKPTMQIWSVATLLPKPDLSKPGRFRSPESLIMVARDRGVGRKKLCCGLTVDNSSSTTGARAIAWSTAVDPSKRKPCHWRPQPTLGTTNSWPTTYISLWTTVIGGFVAGSRGQRLKSLHRSFRTQSRAASRRSNSVEPTSSIRLAPNLIAAR